MAASTVADPISNVLQRTFQNGSGYSPTKIHLNGSMSYEGRGLIRGGSSSSVGSGNHLDSSLQAAAKRTQVANSTVQFDAPIRYVGNLGLSLNGHQTNGSPGQPKPKVIVLNPPQQPDVRTLLWSKFEVLRASGMSVGSNPVSVVEKLVLIQKLLLAVTLIGL